jgi:hypothetical protein
MRRTISEARRAFELDVVPRVNDFGRQQFEAKLREEEAKARAAVAEVISGQEARVLQLRDQSLRELTEVRDEFDRLDAEAGDGRLDAAHLAEQLDVLKHRQDAAESRLQRAAERVDYVDRAEQDPIAWYDDLIERMPQLKPDWPW